MMNRTRDGHKYFFNVHTLQFSWERAEGVKKDHALLTREEIQVWLPSCYTDVCEEKRS